MIDFSNNEEVAKAIEISRWFVDRMSGFGATEATIELDHVSLTYSHYDESCPCRRSQLEMNVQFDYFFSDKSAADFEAAFDTEHKMREIEKRQEILNQMEKEKREREKAEYERLKKQFGGT